MNAAEQTTGEVRYTRRARSTRRCRRLTVRRVNEDTVAQWAALDAWKSGHCVVACKDGGGVANSYGYRAVTECLLVYAHPDGRCIVGMDRSSANKITEARAARVAGAGWLDEATKIFDGRYKASSQDAARKELSAEARFEAAWALVGE